MKKLLSIIALAAFLVLPFKANAEGTIELKQTEIENGDYLVEVYVKVAAGTTYSEFAATLNATNAIIKETNGSDLFPKVEDSSTLDPAGKTARLVTRFASGSELIYTGTGEAVKVAEFKYAHDTTAPEGAECLVEVIPEGGTGRTVSPNKTVNPKTGSALPYVGIAAGIALIAGAYVVSKRSTKLYRM